MIGASPGKGRGLFADKKLEKDEVVLEFVGKKVSCSVEKALPDWLQIDRETFLDLSDHYSFFVNHSCTPNCKILITDDKVYLVALRDIEKEEELYFDYSTTSTDTLDTWQMSCLCEKDNCRHTITGWTSLSRETFHQYRINKMLPLYIA